MNPTIERAVYLVVIVALGGYVAQAGAEQTRLERGVGYPAKQLLRELSSKGFKPQVVDLRALEDEDDDDVGGYAETHIPGSIPFPGCDLTKMPASARLTMRTDVATVIVSRDGDRASFERCAAHFSRVRNLQGGAAAWIEAGLPEADGPFTPPKMGGGGGCL